MAYLRFFSADNIVNINILRFEILERSSNVVKSPFPGANNRKAKIFIFQLIAQL